MNNCNIKKKDLKQFLISIEAQLAIIAFKRFVFVGTDQNVRECIKTTQI